MSTQEKKAAKLTALAVILVSVFAAAMYYGIPDGARTKWIAFALGPSSTNTQNSTIYSLATLLNATFENGTVWTSVRPPYELNSTEITQILILPAPSYGGGLDLKEPYLVTLQYAFDWEIHTTLASQNPTDLGTLQVANYTFSFYQGHSVNGQSYPIPQNFSVPRLNYTLGVNTTGYWDIGMPPPFHGPWTWRIDPNRIRDIIANSANPAEVHFDFDLTVNVYYQIFTLHATQAGYATVAWSGRWATLQLLHDGSQLLGFRYSDLDIGLSMMAS